MLTLVLLSGCSLMGQKNGNVINNGTTKSAQETIREAQSKLYDQEMQQGNVVGSLALDMTAQEGAFKAGAKFDASFDMEVTGNEKINILLTIDGEGNAPDVAGNINLDMNIITVAKDLFLNVKTLNLSAPDQPELQQQIQAMITPYLGKWWKFPLEATGMEFNALLRSNMTPEQDKALRDLLAKTDLFTVTQDHGMTKINGKDVHHYTTDLHEDNAVVFAKEVAKIMNEAEPSLAEMEELKNELVKLNLISELWIGHGDSYIYQMNLKANIDEPEQQAKGTLYGEMNFDPSKKATITAPEGAQDFVLPGGTM